MNYIAFADERRLAGTVRYSDGTPAAHCKVEALDFELVAKAVKLGSAICDAAGVYEIRFSVAKLTKRRKTNPDLIVKAFDSTGKLLATSALVPNAVSGTVVNLQIDGVAKRRSEYNQLLDAIQPRLRGKPLADLTAEDVAYLSAVTSQYTQKVEQLAVSARCALDFTSPEGELSDPVFYAWLSEELSQTASQLIMQPRARLTQALQRAVAANVVSEPEPEEVARILERNAARKQLSVPQRVASTVDAPWTNAIASLLRHSRSAREMRPAPAGEPLSAFDLFGGHQPAGGNTQPLVVPRLSEEKLLVLAELRADAETTGMVSVELLATHGFTPAEIALTARLTSLAELTGNDRALVLGLHGAAAIDPDRPSGSLIYLARLQSAQWHELVADGPALPGNDDSDRGSARFDRAAELEQKIEAAFRTAVIAARIEQHQIAVPAGSKRDLNSFFASNPDFEFGPQSVHRALSEAGARLNDIVDLPALRNSLLSLERTHKLTNNHAQQSVLLANAFDSAASIARVGSRDFVARIGAHPEIGPAQAALIYARAQQVASIALNLRLRQHDAGVNLAVLERANTRQRSSDAVAERSQVQIPDLATLFGSLDGGAIDPCLSATSPAAYLADLLHFLRDRRTEPGEVSVELTVADIEVAARSLDGHALPVTLRDAIAEATQLPMTASPRITTRIGSDVPIILNHSAF